MQKLLNGYERFRAGHLQRHRDLYASLANGQSPRVLVIACSDSRVDPAAIFDAKPGEMFVVRNVANLAPPCEDGNGLHGTSAALEFAVNALKVKLVVVLGHGGCGGCEAALHGAPETSSRFVAPWVALLEEACEKARRSPDPQGAMEREGVRISLRNLMTFPFVKRAVDAGELKLAGAWFSIGEGRLEILDRERDVFIEAETSHFPV